MVPILKEAIPLAQKEFDAANKRALSLTPYAQDSLIYNQFRIFQNVSYEAQKAKKIR